MRDLEACLPAMRAAWMGGRSAIDQAPAEWRTAAGEGAGAEPALAALAAHAAHTLFRLTPPADLAARPPLPQIAAPTPPDPVRGRIRRVLAGKEDELRLQGLVGLLAGRGYAMHPADWLPGPRDDWAPDLYGPWLAWAASERSSTPEGEVTMANFDDWPAAQRRAALGRLRRADPAAAREIIAARAAGEPAERRLQLIQLLEVRLEAADAEFLETVAGDRSDRVRALARRLLARLNRGRGDEALAVELAAMVELARAGLISRRHQLKLKPLKTQAQENRRRELLGQVSLADLARALGVGETALVESAPTGQPLAALEFVQMVAETGSDAAWRGLLDRVLKDGDAPLTYALALAARTAPAERLTDLPQVVSRETAASLDAARRFADGALGALAWSVIAASPGVRALTSLAQKAAGDEAVSPPDQAQLAAGLFNLGLLADHGAAERALAAFTSAGLSTADPRLDMLHINAALKPERPK